MKLCECGCGRPAPIATRNKTSLGHVKGQPVRFIRGHNGKPITPVRTRFMAFVRLEGECWLWDGALDQKHGYGHFFCGGKRRYDKAYRIAYELFVGPIPKGCHVHHTCEVKRCVNPEHLAVVTPLEHGEAHRARTCVHGHRRRQAPGGRWYCPGCQAAYHARKRKEALPTESSYMAESLGVAA